MTSDTMDLTGVFLLAGDFEIAFPKMIDAIRVFLICGGAMGSEHAMIILSKQHWIFPAIEKAGWGDQVVREFDRQRIAFALNARREPNLIIGINNARPVDRFQIVSDKLPSGPTLTLRQEGGWYIVKYDMNLGEPE